MNFTIKSTLRGQEGFSLIEVLIAIVVLSFGLLGTVGLQATALQANRDARLQSAAMGLARELAEMMRGNKDIALVTTNNPYDGDYSSPLTPTTASYCLKVSNTTTTTSTNACAGASAAITQTNIANAQMTEWLTRLDQELPGARVVICDDTQPYNGSGIPQWACTAGAAATKVVKIGWTRSSTNSTLTGSNAFEKVSGANAAAPSIVLAVTPGNTL